MEQEFTQFGESLKHKLGSIIDPASHTCFAGTVVASWSLMQEVAG